MTEARRPRPRRGPRPPRTTTLAAAWLALVVASAVFAPWLGLDDPTRSAPCAAKPPTVAVDADNRPVLRNGRYQLVAQPGCPLQAAADDHVAALPSGRHLLGTDEIGRDVLSRLVFGSRSALMVGFVAIGVALVAGCGVGMIAGFAGGVVDRLITQCFNVVLAIPGMVLIITIVGALDRGLLSVCIGVALVALPVFGHVARVQTRVIAARDHVTASRAAGARATRVVRIEIVPSLLPQMAGYYALASALALTAEGGLALLGLSVREPTATWGGMIAGGRQLITTYPNVVLMPTIMMFVTILAINRLGDHFASRLDTRQSAW